MRRQTRIIRGKNGTPERRGETWRTLDKRHLVRESGSQQRCLLCLTLSGHFTLEVLDGSQSYGDRGCGHLMLVPFTLRSHFLERQYI